jgi:hypothetical protein
MSVQRLPRRELRDLAAEAGELGWTWERTGSGHLKWSHPDVQRAVFTAGTPTNRSGIAEERAKLRRALRLATGGKAA